MVSAPASLTALWCAGARALSAQRRCTRMAPQGSQGAPHAHMHQACALGAVGRPQLGRLAVRACARPPWPIYYLLAHVPSRRRAHARAPRPPLLPLARQGLHSAKRKAASASEPQGQAHCGATVGTSLDFSLSLRLANNPKSRGTRTARVRYQVGASCASAVCTSLVLGGDPPPPPSAPSSLSQTRARAFRTHGGYEHAGARPNAICARARGDQRVVVFSADRSDKKFCTV